MLLRRRYKPLNLHFAENSIKFDEVDIIVGVEFYEACMLSESGTHESTFLRNTKFGWIISDSFNSDINDRMNCCGKSTIDIQQQFKDFWKNEKTAPGAVTSSEDDLCVELFEK